MAKGKSKQSSEYKHETLLLRTEQYRAMQNMTREQKGDLLTLIYQYSMYETVEETGDSFVDGVFALVQSSLDSNWKKYDEKVQKESIENAIKGIISQLKCGNTISQKSIEFLKDHGLFNKELLEKRGISKETLNALFEADAKARALEELEKLKVSSGSIN